MTRPAPHLFCLRHDPLRWIIAGLLLYPAWGSAQDGIQPAPHPGGAIAGVDPSGSATVITPIAPDAHGTSHNLFEHYNVGLGGVVINNALTAGHSQLAGQLNANPQYQGHAASLIINQVISEHQSRILGAQEIFGQAADYVLANPNGIYVNGASFINVPRASFVVGRTELDGTGLSHFDTLRGDGLLEVGPAGLLNRQGAISLIAPRLETHGSLDGVGQLDLIAGNNRVRYGDGDITEVAQRSRAEQRYDASLFGAMRAGRIRIVSTGEGAGVRIASPSVKADDGLRISSAGELLIDGNSLDPKDVIQVELDAGRGRLDLQSQGDMRLRAIKGTGRHIYVRSAKNLYMDPAAQQTLDEENESWKRKAWFITTETYERQRTTRNTQQRGSVLAAEQDVTLEAGDNAALKDVFAHAGRHLRVKTGGHLNVDAGVDRKQMNQTSAHRKHLWREDTQSEEITESTSGSLLYGQQVTLLSGGDLHVRGSRVESAGDIDITARNVDIDTVALLDSSGAKRYRGDLVAGHVFGKKGKDDDKGVTHQGSQVIAEGKLTISTDRLTVRGSTVKGTDDARLISKQKGVFIESVENIREQDRSTSSSQVFGLLGKSKESQQQDVRNAPSEVHSDSNLQVTTPGDVAVKGSRTSAGKQLRIDAQGDVLFTPAQDRSTQNEQQTTRGFTASAGETKQAQDGKPGSLQYAASVGYEVETTNTRLDTSQLARSTVQAEQLTINAKGKAVFDSTDVAVGAGGARVDANSIALPSTAGTDNHVTERTRAGGGLEVTGGMDRVGSATVGYRTDETTTQQNSSADPTRMTIKGNLDLIAPTGSITKTGAKLDVDGTFTERAAQIDNRAATNSSLTRTDVTSTTGKAGMSVEYKDITRPIEKSIRGQEQTRFQQNGMEDAMDPPSLGIDLQAAHQTRKALDGSHKPVVTEVTAGALDIAAPRIADEGTRYAAQQGQVKITADEHRLMAAKETTESRLDRLDVDAALRIDTVTGKDINVKALGIGSSLRQSDTTQTAVPGSLTGKQGIAVQLGATGVYEGSKFDGGQGDVKLHSDGTLAMPQANDSQASDSESLGGYGFAKVTTVPGASKGLALQGKLEYSDSHTRDTQARVAQINTAGHVDLSAKGDITLEGPRIGTPELPPKSITVAAGDRAQVLASSDTHEATGNTLGGAAQLGASANPTAGSKGGALGGAFTAGRIDEQAQTRRGAQLNSQDSTRIQGDGSRADAVHLEGLEVQTKHLELVADNGGIVMESAQSTDTRNNLQASVGAGANAKRDPADSSANNSGLYGRVKVDIEQLDSTLHDNSTVTADTIKFKSGGDTRFAGANLDARIIEGDVGGELTVQTRQDQVDGLTLNVDLKLSKEKNPQGLINAVTSVAGPAGGKVNEKVGKQLSKVDPNITPTIRFDVVQQQRDTATQAAALNASERFDLQVAGNTNLTGATLGAPNRINLSNGVVQTDLHGTDYRAETGFNAANTPVDLGMGIKEAAGKDTPDGVNLGLVRGGGHTVQQTLEAGVLQ